MNAREALRTGELDTALDLLKAEIRKEPRNAELRVFLFQLFCITGDWDRALTQLSVAGELDPQADAMVQTYQVLIRCEVLREKIFRGERSPTVFGEPSPWVPMLVEAARLLGCGEADRALQLRDAAFEAAPQSRVIVDGAACEWAADADPRLGPMIEAVVEGRYVWVPYTALSAVAMDPPADLRDQVWMPARFKWSNQGETVGFIPTRYPGTTETGDAALLLARRTEWTERGEWSLPVGQRMIVTDVSETALMDLRELRFHTAAAAA